MRSSGISHQYEQFEVTVANTLDRRCRLLALFNTIVSEP